jgi:choline-sulfatase
VNSEATSPTNAAARNMLILLSDEHHYRVMGCAGDTTIHTPHLDALAARGTRFANAYTPSPICVPARASLATGLPVHQHRCWDNALAWTGEPKGWGHALKEAGHRVESIGKLHFRDAESDTGLSDQHLPLHVQAGMGQVWGSVRDPLPATRGRSPLYYDLGVGESSYNRFDQQVTQKKQVNGYTKLPSNHLTNLGCYLSVL